MVELKYSLSSIKLISPILTTPSIVNKILEGFQLFIKNKNFK